ncbi:MAG: anti-sigma factor [Planctomycetota bacterium]
MSTTGINDDRDKLELLAGHVLGDLSDEESERLEAILSDNDTRQALWELERTAATVQVAIGAQMDERLPEHVADQIRASARDILLSESSDVEAFVQPAKPATAAPVRELFAWFCAAACLIFAFSFWQPNEESTAETRSSLIAQAETIQVNWTAGKTPFASPVEGDVVWDNTTQTGFMRFVNMPINDPTIEQYQLWIIDPERDDEPIDGGVFDITSEGEVLVKIDAKLAVVNPAAFAITIEKAGGVVVSSQERLPLLAAVEG